MNLFAAEGSRYLEHGKHRDAKRNIISSFEDLEYYSLKSSDYFRSVRSKRTLAWVDAYLSKHGLVYESLLSNKCRIHLVYDSLNKEQQNAFISVHKLLSSAGNGILTLDAAPGTGKTFLLACIGITVAGNVQYVVYSNNLESLMTPIRGIQSMTCCKHLIQLTGKSYVKIKFMFFEKDLTLIEKLWEIVDVARSSKIDDGLDLLIVDEYTVLHPWHIIFLYTLTIFNNFNILFVGNKDQQKSIGRTRNHSKNNYTLLEILSDKIMTLHTPMRQKDALFIEKLTTFKEYITPINSMDDPPLYFDIKLLLFELFTSNFLRSEDYSATFVAFYHAMIRDRIERTIDHLKIKKANFLCSWYTIIRDGKIYECKINSTSKFPMYLLLVKGYRYFYTDKNNLKHLVELLDYDTDTVTIGLKKRRIIIKRESIKSSFMIEEVINNVKNELKLFLKTDILPTIYQFPLQYNSLTFYSAQGLTLDVDKIDINLDSQTINSIYVGLTRIKRLNQLNAIITHDLIDLMITSYFNDEYFYKCDIDLRSKMIPIMLDSIITCKTFKPIGDLNRRSFLDVSPVIFSRNTNSGIKRKSTRHSMRVNRIDFKNFIYKRTATPIELSTNLEIICKILKKHGNTLKLLSYDNFKCMVERYINNEKL